MEIYPSRLSRDGILKKIFCSKSCHRSYKNKIDNPSKHRDLSGEHNPMWGKHPEAWNKGMYGEDSPNWKGGIQVRKDGYVRIAVRGERHLLHRFLLKEKIKSTDVIHHIDHNPSNNSIDNLMVFPNQSEHVKYERNN